MNPYDADAALESIRPRLIAAKARRRRVASTSAAVAMLAVSSVAAAAVLTPSDDTTSVVAVSPDDQSEPATTTTSTEPSAKDSHAEDSNEEGAGEVTEKAASPDPDPTTSTTTKPPPPPAPSPTKDAAPTTQPPPPPPQTVNHTFTYPGTGSVTVAQTGNSLAYVSSSAEAGWTHKLSHESPDLIGVEFTKDNVQRWLKVKIVNGEVVAQQHEHIKCVPPPSTSTHDAPNAAGSITVQVGDAGKLSLVGTNPAAGWNAEVIHDKPDVVKVGFRNQNNTFVWIQVRIAGCDLKVESG